MLRDFVFQTSNAPGSAATINLIAPPAGRASFVGAFGGAASVFYVMEDGAAWEVGEGSVAPGSPETLARTTVLANSLGTLARVNFGGLARVYCSLPSARAVYRNAAGQLQAGTEAGAALLARLGVTATGQAVATAPTAGAARSSIGQMWGGTAGGTADAISLTVSPLPGGLEAGAMVRFLAAATNTGAVTIAVPGLAGGAAQPLLRGHGAPLRAGILRPGHLVRAIWDGAAWRMDEQLSGWMEVERQPVSGVAALDFTLQTAHYARFALHIARGRVATGGQALGLRCGAGGVFDAGASDYNGGQLTHTGTVVAGGGYTSSLIDISGALAANDTRSSIVVEIDAGTASEPFLARVGAGVIESGANFRNYGQFGARATAAVRDQLRVLASGGASISGTFTLLGSPA